MLSGVAWSILHSKNSCAGAEAEEEDDDAHRWKRRNHPMHLRSGSHFSPYHILSKRGVPGRRRPGRVPASILPDRCTSFCNLLVGPGRVSGRDFWDGAVWGVLTIHATKEEANHHQEQGHHALIHRATRGAHRRGGRHGQREAWGCSCEFPVTSSQEKRQGAIHVFHQRQRSCGRSAQMPSEIRGHHGGEGRQQGQSRD